MRQVGNGEGIAWEEKRLHFDPTVPLPTIEQGRPDMGNKMAKQEREDAPAIER
jgi:hypothetical protein